MKMLRKALLLPALALAFLGIAEAANIPNTPVPTDPSQMVYNFNLLISEINSLITPTSMGNAFNFRNLLDNGAGNVQQRGTGAATCATTSGLVAASYGPDRWGCDVNVASGAGQLTAGLTSTPAPPVGFQYSTTLVRNSGSLAQPQCAWQEIPTSRVTALQGQPVVFSGQLLALAGLAADNGSLANLVVIYGTGTDQGMGALRSAVGMTASPAITPVWTGLTTLANQQFTITTAWARYQTTALSVPTTVTEMAVAVCFTPTTTSSGGSTDGLAFVGMQLENSNLNPSAYENRPYEVELTKALAYYWKQTEISGAVFGSGMCQATNTPKILIQLPEPMVTTPVAAWTVGGFSLAIAGAGAAGATGGAGANLAAAPTGIINLSFTNTCTAGATMTMVGTNTTGSLTVSADF